MGEVVTVFGGIVVPLLSGMLQAFLLLAAGCVCRSVVYVKYVKESETS